MDPDPLAGGATSRKIAKIWDDLAAFCATAVPEAVTVKPAVLNIAADDFHAATPA